MSVQYEYTTNKININDVEVVSRNEQRAILKFNSKFKVGLMFAFYNTDKRRSVLWQ